MDPPQPAENFSTSNGWLDNFKARNKIIARTLEGERASVPMDTVQDFKNKLPTLLADNDPKDVYNGIEVGLYYEQTARKTLMEKGEDLGGEKVNKKRVTVYIVVAMDGDLEPLVVINNAKTPRAFRKIKNDLSRLPPCIQWYSSPKGWMNGDIFEQWLEQFNTKMQGKGRHVILFLDNFSGHIAGVEELEEKDGLSNVKVVWLPANRTSMVQLVDQGIGQALKLRYSNNSLLYCQ